MKKKKEREREMCGRNREKGVQGPHENGGVAGHLRGSLPFLIPRLPPAAATAAVGFTAHIRPFLRQAWPRGKDAPGKCFIDFSE